MNVQYSSSWNTLLNLLSNHSSTSCCSSCSQQQDVSFKHSWRSSSSTRFHVVIKGKLKEKQEFTSNDSFIVMKKEPEIHGWETLCPKDFVRGGKERKKEKRREGKLLSAKKKEAKIITTFACMNSFLFLNSFFLLFPPSSSSSSSSLKQGKERMNVACCFSWSQDS